MAYRLFRVRGNAMKVLTIKQPWATLIAEGYKEYEFRTWNTKFRGELLIHAGKGIDREAMKRFEYLNLSYPTGAIIAKVRVSDCIIVDDYLREELERKDKIVYRNVIMDKTWNGYAFKIENVQKIKPIDINGKLGLWNYDFKDR